MPSHTVLNLGSLVTAACLRHAVCTALYVPWSLSRERTPWLTAPLSSAHSNLRANKRNDGSVSNPRFLCLYIASSEPTNHSICITPALAVRDQLIYALPFQPLYTLCTPVPKTICAARTAFEGDHAGHRPLVGASQLEIMAKSTEARVTRRRLSSCKSRRCTPCGQQHVKFVGMISRTADSCLAVRRQPSCQRQNSISTKCPPLLRETRIWSTIASTVATTSLLDLALLLTNAPESSDGLFDRWAEPEHERLPAGWTWFTFSSEVQLDLALFLLLLESSSRSTADITTYAAACTHLQHLLGEVPVRPSLALKQMPPPNYDSWIASLATFTIISPLFTCAKHHSKQTRSGRLQRTFTSLLSTLPIPHTENNTRRTQHISKHHNNNGYNYYLRPQALWQMRPLPQGPRTAQLPTSTSQVRLQQPRRQRLQEMLGRVPQG
jgi:hypothetical protein